jgi:hypothetical protein
MRDALHLTKFANFGRRCPVPHAGARSWFSAARGLPKAVEDASTPPSPQEIRMSVACLHGLWLGHFASLELLAARRGLLVTLPAQSGACIHNWTSREPVFAAGKDDILVQ